MLGVGSPSREEKEKVAESAPGVDAIVWMVQAREGLEQKYELSRVTKVRQRLLNGK